MTGSEWPPERPADRPPAGRPPGWHASPASLARLVDDPRSVDEWTAASLEAHLVSCAACRGQLTAVADPALAAASWAALADRIDRPVRCRPSGSCAGSGSVPGGRAC